MHAQSLHRQEMPLPGESGELLNYLKIIEKFLVYVLRKAKVKVGNVRGKFENNFNI